VRVVTLLKRVLGLCHQVVVCGYELFEVGFVVRHEDPARDQRPQCSLTDPFLQFHYAVLEPHGPELRDREPADVWARSLRHVFDSQVRGPVFEEQARTWVRRFAGPDTLAAGGHVGPSSAKIDGVHRVLDLVVAEGSGPASARTITAVGEAKAGERLDVPHLDRLERARASFGIRAVDAKLLLFGSRISPALASKADTRPDVEIIDLERLCTGS